MAPIGPAAPILFTAQQWGAIVIILLLGLGLKAIVLWWLYRDTLARGRDPLPWILFAVVLDIPTLIVWLILRPPFPDGPRRRTEAPRAREGPAAGTEVGPGPGATAPRLAPAPAPGGATGPTPQTQRVRLTCPRCAHAFTVARNAAGPTPIECPECGMTGRL